MTKEKVWFITGSSRGFGRIWAEAALKRGDKVVATARKLESISDLKDQYEDLVLPLEMDVTNAEQVNVAVKTGLAHFGRLDIVFNNAGYSLIGTIEEASVQEVKDMYETNVFGVMNVLHATLPVLRKQGFGHILGTSSAVGHYSLPAIGFYSSTKWALEAIYESLQKEVADFGIKVTLIEPGAYATEFGSKESLKIATNLIPAYTDLKSSISANMKKMTKGNPTATTKAILTVVDAEHPPLRLLLGRNNRADIERIYKQRIQTWKDWEEISEAAHG